MRMLKCEVCGKTTNDFKSIKEIQIRKYKNMLDTKPVLERTLDVCVDCLNDIFGGENEEKE